MTPFLGGVATCQRDALGGADGSGNALAAGHALSHEVSQLKPLRLISRRYLDSYKAPLICDLIMRNSEHFDSTAIDHFFNQSYMVARSKAEWVIDWKSKPSFLRGDRGIRCNPLGGVQIPSAGQPIVLMRDHGSLGAIR